MSAPTLPDPVDFSAGEPRLGPYRLLRPISAGGMARVYEGRLDSLAGVTTRVAVKVIHPDFANEAAFQELFITEARISARLEHQNLVRIQQFNREGNLYYLVMEYIDGVTFRKIISLCRRHRLQLPVQVIAELGRQVCEGLHYAHNLATESGELLHLVHRDIKPSNLMLNGHGVAKVLDFGISSAHGTPESGAVKGTWGYMALEQAEGGLVGPAADVFGLGAVLYELAALEPLFAEKDNAVVRQRLLDDTGAARAAALGGEWSDLGGVLVRALQRDPDARHRNAAVFGRALSTLVLDPVGVHDSLVRLLRELRALDGAPTAQTQEKPRSMPTMSRTGLGSPRIEPQPALPVRFGDAHGAGPAPRAASPAPPSRLPATLAAAGLLAVVLAVLAFTAWQLLFGAPRRPPAVAEPTVSTPSLAAVVGAAPSAGTPPAAPSSSTPSASTSSAATPPAATPPTATTATAASPAVPAVTPAASSKPSTSTPASAPPTASSASTRPPRTPPTASSTAAEPDAPVRIAPSATASTAPASAPAAVPTPAPAATAATTTAPEARHAEGLLTISSDPRAQVMINGQYVRYTPVFQYAMPAGTHSVVLVAEDGRRKSFKVTVEANAETRKIWLFDEERWSDP